MRRGVRCAAQWSAHSYTQLLQHLGGGFITFRSDWLPMIIPTTVLLHAMTLKFVSLSGPISDGLQVAVYNGDVGPILRNGLVICLP